jgi:hypothetical protein
MSNVIFNEEETQYQQFKTNELFRKKKLVVILVSPRTSVYENIFK